MGRQPSSCFAQTLVTNAGARGRHSSSAVPDPHQRSRPFRFNAAEGSAPLPIDPTLLAVPCSARRMLLITGRTRPRAAVGRHRQWPSFLRAMQAVALVVLGPGATVASRAPPAVRACPTTRDRPRTTTARRLPQPDPHVPWVVARARRRRRRVGSSHRRPNPPTRNDLMLPARRARRG